MFIEILAVENVDVVCVQGGVRRRFSESPGSPAVSLMMILQLPEGGKQGS